MGPFINPHQTGFVGKDSDHLKLIRFWPSQAPGKWVCGGAKILAVFARLRAFFFILHTLKLTEIDRLEASTKWRTLKYRSKKTF